MIDEYFRVQDLEEVATNDLPRIKADLESLIKQDPERFVVITSDAIPIDVTHAEMKRLYKAALQNLKEEVKNFSPSKIVSVDLVSSWKDCMNPNIRFKVTVSY